MAKQDLVKEAQGLGIEVLPDDTVAIIQSKIDEAKKKVSEEEKDKTVVKVPGGFRRVKVNHDELMKLQAECKLVGYDSATNEAIVK
ncbi:hypothetical protein EPO66_05715 [bacterium]|nr:MAG: hypothetical protein EPO66_05715 [bacterium]